MEEAGEGMVTSVRHVWEPVLSHCWDPEGKKHVKQ